jgi:hypothetical protein
MGTPLKRVDTLKLVQLDLPREEGGYPRDCFTAGELPGGRARLEIECVGGDVRFIRRTTTLGEVVGIVPTSAICMMHLQSQKDSL